MKPNYYIIPALTLALILINRYFISHGLEWYTHLVLPRFAPAYWSFGLGWHIAYILAMISAMYVWNRFVKNFNFWVIIGLFAANAGLNIAWNYLFFSQHKIGASLLTLLALELVTIILIKQIWHRSLLSALILIPYAVWIAYIFAINYAIWVMNIS